MTRWVDRETGETEDEVPFEAVYDSAVLRVMDAKGEHESAKAAAKEAKEALELAIDNLQNLRRPKKGPRQMPLHDR